jgi:hypothetical protein
MTFVLVEKLCAGLLVQLRCRGLWQPCKTSAMTVTFRRILLLYNHSDLRIEVDSWMSWRSLRVADFPLKNIDPRKLPALLLAVEPW